MSKTTKTGGGTQPGKSAANTAKDKVVKPETEDAVKDAAAAITGTAKHASGVAKDQAENAKATAAEAIGTAKEEAKTQGENLKGQARAKAGEARAKATEMTDEAKRRAREEAEERKQQATGAMSTTAQDLRKASSAVEETWMAKAFDVAAEQVEGVTRSVENKSPEEMVQVARQAARNNPGLFLAGCFAAGVAISRTLKVAAARQPQHYYDDDGQRPSGGRLSSDTGTYTALGTSSAQDSSLPDVGGSSAPSGQVGIGSGTRTTDGLGTSSDTTNR